LNIFSLFLIKTPNSKIDKLKWFLLNVRYSSIFKIRNFKKKISKKENIWSDYSKHFNYISEYYPAKNILKAPIVQKTMFDKNAKLQKINSKSVQDTINDISKEIEASFFISKNISKAWLSIFGSIIEQSNILEPDFENLVSSNYFIEFGPGLGFNAEIYSRLFNSRGILFDLPEIKNVRSIVIKEFKKYSDSDNKSKKPEEFSEIKSFLNRVKTLQKYSFFSTWAFTESPLDIRKKFFNIINNSVITLIVSNPKFENIDNFEYLNNLGEKLKYHNHIYKDLGFLKNSPKYLKKHQLHLFINKNIKS
tara:strand:+ start:110 stop:1027 length:918 start_codon:yes stop_codon:yes gene_type:complete